MRALRLIPLITRDCQLVLLRSTTSTNDEARRRLEANMTQAARPLVVLSSEQTAGRGRQGHLWASPPGGIYLSLLWHGTISSQQAASLSLVAAQATCEALARFTSEPLRIKWPNDVFIPAGKLAGILVENTGEQGTYIIGVGLNVTPSVSGEYEGAAYLADVEMEPMAAALIDALIEQVRQWERRGCPSLGRECVGQFGRTGTK
jgi:BirA family biotin operon repressor/biotin-[acetyl-CoA-carboxylase] ligase